MLSPRQIVPDPKDLTLMQSLACLNGELMPVDDAKVSVSDRGFLFGDSVYEVFRLYQGRLWLEAEHMTRLRRSLGEIEFPPIDLGLLLDRIRRTVAASQVEDGTAYIQITRGVAPRAHHFPSPPVAPTELIVVKAYRDEPTAQLRESGVALISQPDLRWGRCDMKTTNLLANVIALEQAHRAGGFEAVLIDRDGLVTEATHSSLLWIREGQLQATPDGPTILPGTKRHFIETLATQIDLAFAATRVTLDELKAADEVLLVGTTIEVLPVITVDGQPVATGSPGPIARRLQTAYWAAVEHWLVGGAGSTSL